MDVVTRQLAHREPPTLEPADDRDRAGAIPRPALHHVQLKTPQLDAMVEWYVDTLGLVVCFRGSGGAWLTNDEANHRLAILTTPKLSQDPDKVAHAGLHHTAWEYATLDELLTTYARLRDRGQLPHRAVNHGPVTSFYYLDPDDNSVELQVDNFGDWRESVWFMASEAFAEDPYGPGVDPEALIAQRAAGVDAREIARRSHAGEFPNTRPNDRRLPL